jgi:cytochrome P450
VWESTRRLYPAPFRKLSHYLPEMSERYGDIAMFRLANRRFVLLNHPDQIKDMLVTQQHAFIKSLGARTMRMLLGDGLLTSEEPQHRQMRRIVQPAFHRERIEAYAETMTRFAREFADTLQDGAEFEMHAAMSALALRIASETLFGTDASADAAEVRDALHATLQTYPLALGPLGPIRSKLPFLASTKKFNDARARLDRIIYGLIAQRRTGAGGRTDALSLLMESHDPETGLRLRDEQVRDEALTLFLAGHETTANALTWSWWLLAAHPAIAERVASEPLDYARRVLRESMRLYPPAWIVGREAVRDVELVGGYRIRKGTTVFMCPLVLHRRAEFYREPLEFDPERWIDSDVPPFAYVPFGGGARKCIGEEFAWMEGAIVLREIARRWRFELRSAEHPGLLALVTLRPKRPVFIRARAAGVPQS